MSIADTTRHRSPICRSCLVCVYCAANKHINPPWEDRQSRFNCNTIELKGRMAGCEGAAPNRSPISAIRSAAAWKRLTPAVRAFAYAIHFMLTEFN